MPSLFIDSIFLLPIINKIICASCKVRKLSKIFTFIAVEVFQGLGVGVDDIQMIF